MNINEMAVSHGDVASALIVIGAYGMPRHPLFSERRGFACMQFNQLHEIYSGPEMTVYCIEFECITRKSLRKTLLTSIHSRSVCP